MNEFEQKISRQPLRQIPGEWRAEILAAANFPVSRSEAKTASFLSTLNHQLSTINSQPICGLIPKRGRGWRRFGFLFWR
jgi:hypothetical protein